MPAYRQVLQAGVPIEPTGVPLDVPVGQKTVSGRLLLPTGSLAGHAASARLFRRASRNISTAIISTAPAARIIATTASGSCSSPGRCWRRSAGWASSVDVLHVHDWQTGLIPAYLKIEYRTQPGYEKIASLLTIHNLAYQGTFWHWDMLLTGLDWKYFNWRQMEFFGNLNLLKTGLVFADALNTVSPRYAEEIQTAPLGCGLEGVLQQRRGVLSGIINGVDYSQWNPATDPHLPVRLRCRETSAKARRPARRRCKPSWICRTIPHVPLLAFVGRLVEQKGIDLIAQVMQEWVLDQPCPMGDSGHRRREVPGAVDAAGPAVIRRRWRCGCSSPIRWPIGSKPGPTCS